MRWRGPALLEIPLGQSQLADSDSDLRAQGPASFFGEGGRLPTPDGARALDLDPDLDLGKLGNFAPAQVQVLAQGSNCVQPQAEGLPPTRLDCRTLPYPYPWTYRISHH